VEISLTGPTLQAGSQVACVVYGAPFELDSDRQHLSAGNTFTLQPDEILQIRRTREGMRAYFCVRSGLQEPLLLGSRSALKPLRAGEEVHCEPGKIHGRFVRPNWTWNREPRTLRVLDGPQADWFRSEEFYRQEFTVTPACDRIGLRLSGAALSLPVRELVSEPVCPGAVQVTGDGQCIILGVDGQTIGGYPKIAHVIGADLDKLGQLCPGDPIRFVRLNLEEAQAIYRHKRAELHEWLTRLRVTLGE
jgi:allophanate hydrolase subunit 2